MRSTEPEIFPLQFHSSLNTDEKRLNGINNNNCYSTGLCEAVSTKENSLSPSQLAFQKYKFPSKIKVLNDYSYVFLYLFLILVATFCLLSQQESRSVEAQPPALPPPPSHDATGKEGRSGPCPMMHLQAGISLGIIPCSVPMHNWCLFWKKEQFHRNEELAEQQIRLQTRVI